MHGIKRILLNNVPLVQIASKSFFSNEEGVDERNLPGTIVGWHHKKADRILHLAFPPVPQRTLFKVLKVRWNADCRLNYLCNDYLCNGYLCYDYLCNDNLCNDYLCTDYYYSMICKQRPSILTLNNYRVFLHIIFRFIQTEPYPDIGLGQVWFYYEEGKKIEGGCFKRYNHTWPKGSLKIYCVFR